MDMSVLLLETKTVCDEWGMKAGFFLVFLRKSFTPSLKHRYSAERAKVRPLPPLRKV